MTFLRMMAAVLSAGLIFAACPTEGETETDGSPLRTFVRYLFVVENRSSADREVILQMAGAPWGEFYDDHPYSHSGFPLWRVVEEDHPSTPLVVLPPGESAQLSVLMSMAFHPDTKMEMSFLLSIDDTQFAGWPEDLGSGRTVLVNAFNEDGMYEHTYADIDAVRWGLGNVSFATPPEGERWWNTYPLAFASVLNIPPYGHAGQDRFSREVVYRVTILDDDVEFAIDAMYVFGMGEPDTTSG